MLRRSIFIFLMALIMMPTTAHSQEVIRLTSGEWPPYFSESLPHGGVAARIYREAFALEGIQIEYEYQPWKRGLESALDGKTYVGSAGWRKSPERAKHFYLADPIFSIDTVFFHTLGSEFDWTTLHDVGDKKIGVTLGYGYEKMIREAVYHTGGKIDPATTDTMNFEKLLAGRIDLFPCGKEVGIYILKHKLKALNKKAVLYHPRPLISGNIHLLISKKAPNAQHLVESFNRGLKKLHDSGQYDEYFREVFGELAIIPPAAPPSTHNATTILKD